MLETKVASLASALKTLEEIRVNYGYRQGSGQLDREAIEELLSLINQLEEACLSSKFEQPLVAIRTTRKWLTSYGGIYCLYEEVPSQVSHVINAVSEELNRHKFYSLTPDRQQFYERSDLFGESVTKAFPSAQFDIRESGNCLATDRDTAAVFHLMRAVEWGLRAIASHLGFTEVRVKTKKNGRDIYAPIAYSEWEKILDGIQDGVDEKMENLERGPEKQSLQEFYYPALQDIRGIRDAWRNHIMHTRSEISPEDAIAIFGHVKRLLSNLAERIEEI